MPESSASTATQAPAPPLWWSVVQLLRTPAAPAAVLTTGGVLAWIGTQLPQHDAPRWLADGLSRSDHAASAALGLSHLVTGLPMMLWWIAAVAVLAVRAPLFGGAGLGDGTKKLAGVAWLAAASLWAIWVIWNVGQPPVTWLDVDLQAPQPSAQAWIHDLGRPAPAPGRFAGTCQPDASGRELDCNLDVPQGAVKVHLSTGHSEVRQGWQYSWIARSPNPQASHFEFVGAATPGGAPVQVSLQAGRAADAPALHARWIPQATAVAGPAVLAVAENGPLTWWNSPMQSGTAAVGATARVGDRARIAIAPVGGRFICGGCRLRWRRLRLWPGP